MSGKSPWRSALSPLILALGALLLVQLIAALVLVLSKDTLSPSAPSGPLLNFDSEQVTGIRIQTSDAEPLRVLKSDSGWILPSVGDLPAAEQKITGLLAKLQKLEKGLPVATSQGALERFKVAEGSYERKLTLEQDETPLLTLYLGDSPGFQRLFVRTAAEDAVYDVKLGLFDVPERADDWSDRTLLHLKEEDIKGLAIADLTLEREEQDWRLGALAQGEAQDDQAVAEAVRDLTNIGFLGVLGEQEQASADADATPIEINITLASGESLEYRISKLAVEGDYLLEASNRPQRFRLASYAVQDILELNRNKLLVQPEETEDSGQSAATADGEEAGQAPAEPTTSTLDSPPANAEAAEPMAAPAATSTPDSVPAPPMAPESRAGAAPPANRERVPAAAGQDDSS